MAAGSYSHTTRSTGTILTANIYNTDHQNHIDNDDLQHMDDYSSNVSQMQATTSPGDVGTESLATTGSGEVERIRYQLNAIVGGAQWYSAVPASLTTLNSTFGDQLSLFLTTEVFS
jgi:hypothetical protein